MRPVLRLCAWLVLVLGSWCPPRSKQKMELPSFAFRQELLDAVRDNQVLVVVGETGSGVCC